jgi:hypothetical protein
MDRTGKIVWFDWAVCPVVIVSCLPALVWGDATPRTEPHSPQLVLSEPMTTNGVQFQARTMPVWRLPTGHQTTEVPLELTITNGSAQPLRFRLFEAVELTLTRVGGAPLRYHYARDATRRTGWVSDPLPPGAGLTIPRPVHLEGAVTAVAPRAWGPDGFGGIWEFVGVTPGHYRLTVRYVSGGENSNATVPVWSGRVETAPMTIEVQ